LLWCDWRLQIRTLPLLLSSRFVCCLPRCVSLWVRSYICEFRRCQCCDFEVLLSELVYRIRQGSLSSRSWSQACRFAWCTVYAADSSSSVYVCQC
jgi:hypothetical protein